MIYPEIRLRVFCQIWLQLWTNSLWSQRSDNALLASNIHKIYLCGSGDKLVSNLFPCSMECEQNMTPKSMRKCAKSSGKTVILVMTSFITYIRQLMVHWASLRGGVQGGGILGLFPAENSIIILSLFMGNF